MPTSFVALHAAHDAFTRVRVLLDQCRRLRRLGCGRAGSRARPTMSDRVTARTSRASGKLSRPPWTTILRVGRRSSHAPFAPTRFLSSPWLRSSQAPRTFTATRHRARTSPVSGRLPPPAFVRAAPRSGAVLGWSSAPQGQARPRCSRSLSGAGTRGRLTATRAHRLTASPRSKSRRSRSRRRSLLVAAKKCG